MTRGLTMCIAADMEVTVLEDSAEVAALCQRLSHAEFITVDTEFRRQTTYWPELCLIQVAGEDEAVIIALAATLHDVGHVVHRDSHAYYSIPLAADLLDRFDADGKTNGQAYKRVPVSVLDDVRVAPADVQNVPDSIPGLLMGAGVGSSLQHAKVYQSLIEDALAGKVRHHPAVRPQPQGEGSPRFGQPTDSGAPGAVGGDQSPAGVHRLRYVLAAG
jgi:hypothetical protein